MGALSLHSFTADYIEKLHKAGAPAEVLMSIESFLVRTLEPAERRRRAAYLMGCNGAEAAAQSLGVCRQQVYKLAAQHRDERLSRVEPDQLTTVG